MFGFAILDQLKRAYENDGVDFSHLNKKKKQKHRQKIAHFDDDTETNALRDNYF